jgi:hypothetical protein
VEWQYGQQGEIEVLVPSHTNKATILESSTNLETWAEVLTNAPGSAPAIFTDPSAGREARKFYRLRQ